MRTKLLTSLLFIGTLLSCDSDKDAAPTPVNSFDFRYDTHQQGLQDLELILSDKDGKVILDTLLAFNTDHKLRVKSGDTKYDLTTILVDPVLNIYWIQTYLQVNPDKWHRRYVTTSNATVAKEKAEITYTNTPFDQNMYFQTKAPSGYSATWNAGTLKFTNYTRILPTDLAYIVLPTHGKYMFTEITSNQTTVDFTNAGNTVKLKYNRPAGVSNFSTSLYGYTKAGDDKSRLHLYWSAFMSSQEYDLQFPPTGIEAFDLDVKYSDTNGHMYTYISYVNQIPTEIDFASKSDFAVSKPGFEDFAITFTDDKPSIYNMYWSTRDASFDARWNVYSSPETTSFKPKAFLEGLKSKKLQGKNVAAFKLSSVSTQKIKDQSYQKILDIMANPSLSFYKEVKQSRSIIKLF